MKKRLLLAVALALVPVLSFAGPPPLIELRRGPAVALARPGPNGSIAGEYVEARTAEVFTGGCIMGSEAETMGRQAILAWRIDRGSFDGVALDGLSVVAALAGDRNLGIREIGGVAPSTVKAVVTIDDRATSEQRQVLVSLVRAMSQGLISEIAELRSAPVSFSRSPELIRVASTDLELAVETEVKHEASCGAMQWFHPFSIVDEAAIGMTRTQAFSGPGLGVKWSDPGKKSAFFGTFRY